MENISTAKVSRMLDKAHKEGLIEIKVIYPLQSVVELSEAIREYFGLKKVFVVPVIINHPDAILNDIGKMVNNYLSEIIQNGDIVGVSWGTTLTYVVKHLTKHNSSDITVVQLNGGVTRNYLSTHSGSIIEGFVHAYNAVPFMLPVPTIVDSAELAKAITSDSNVSQVLALGAEARIAIYGIGRVSFDSILMQAGFFKQEEYQELIQKGAVGDICSRYFDLDGNIADVNLNNRTVGITLEELAAKEHSIAIASGEEKVKAIIGALRGQYVNTLFIDEIAAKKCLEFLNIKY